MKKNLCFIDFEASSLSSSSYPVEVAWSLEDGEIESHLIDPSSISTWTDWDTSSEVVHGISLEKLKYEGKPPNWIAERMNAVLEGKILLTNGFDYDWDWCNILFRAVNIEMRFVLGDAWHVFGRQMMSRSDLSLESVILEQPLTTEQTSQILGKINRQAWDEINCRRHQAACDVAQLVKMWELIQNY